MTMRPRAVFGAIAAGMLISLGAFGAALAQDESQGDQTQMLEQLGDDSDQAANPPGRAAQLSDAEGSVSLEPAGTSSWTAAALNRPLTLGDKLWTDRNSRAELDIGDAVIRLGSTTGFSFLNLDEQTAQMQVTAGTAIVHVRSLASGEQDEIDTPNLALTLEQPGTYRVEVSDSGDTTIVKVDDGAALATGGGQSYPVAAQQSVTFTGTSTLAADYASLGSPDALDDWSYQRDQQEQQALAAQENVPPDTVGADDLASYGTWDDTEWGDAWFPTVAAGWAPYSLGYWVWVSPWGWSWIDQEPWGFAPFHYGRWGYWHHRWCWVPGPRGIRPVYAPALVAWVGGARVGWFALGPHDVYVPGRHFSAAYVRNINVTNARLTTADVGNVYEGHVTNIRYANSGVPGAVTAVPRGFFTSAQPVGPHRVILSQQSVAGLRPTTAAPAIAPVRQSVLGVNAGRFAGTPPRMLVDRPVVARLAPPRAPVPFAREQAAIRANGGRPLGMAELSRLRPNTPAAAVRLSSPAQDRGGVRGSNMAVRERTLQQPTLSPGRIVRNDRPPWAQGRAQRQAAPGRQAPMERFAPAPRQSAEYRAPQQHFASPPREAPEEHFSPPPRAAPAPQFTPPVRQIPQQHFASPSYNRPAEHFSAPHGAAARAPERAPEARRPPSAPRASADRRAAATPVSFGTDDAQPWQSPPPMYRPQQGTERYAAPAQLADPAATSYRPPLSPPPMYRPIPMGGAAARAPAHGPGRLAIEHFRAIG